MEFIIRAATLSVMTGAGFIVMVLMIVENMTLGLSGGIPEEEAEDER